MMNSIKYFKFANYSIQRCLQKKTERKKIDKIKKFKLKKRNYTVVKDGAIMTKEELTKKILYIKREKGWSWDHVCNQIGGLSPILIVGALLGQHKLMNPLSQKAATLFGLTENERKLLEEIPM